MILLSLLSLALAGRGVSQSIQPPTFYPYTGPQVAYPSVNIAFSLLAKDHQPDSLGSNFEYQLLAAPTNSSFGITFGRLDEKFMVINWQTPPRLSLGATNRFVIKATDHGTPPLSATNEISFVMTDCPPIRSIAKSNDVIMLQIADLLPGKPYFVQFADALSPTNWSPLVDVVPPSPAITLTDTNPPATQRFYRLLSYGWCDGFGCP